MTVNDSISETKARISTRDMQVFRMEQAYAAAQTTKVGGTIACPTCHSLFTKTAHNRVFCASDCKDTYWTTVNIHTV